jgi:hypothetical protein
VQTGAVADVPVEGVFRVFHMRDIGHVAVAGHLSDDTGSADLGYTVIGLDDGLGTVIMREVVLVAIDDNLIEIDDDLIKRTLHSQPDRGGQSDLIKLSGIDPTDPIR